MGLLHFPYKDGSKKVDTVDHVGGSIHKIYVALDNR